MAITGEVVLSNTTVSGTQEVPLVVKVYNDDAVNEVTLTGITLTTPNQSIVALGEIPAFSTAYFQTSSGGTAVTSSIPKWGTGEQASKTISNADLYYWVGNVSGSSLGVVNYDGNLVLPANSTSSFVAAVTPLNAPFLPEPVITAEIGALIQISGTTQPVVATTDTLNITSKPVARIACQLVGVPAVVTKNEFSRPPNYSNFDAIVSTTIVYTDGTEIVINPQDNFPIVNDYTSSDPSVVSVVQNGAFTSTTSSLQLTNSVGEVYGGQNTQLIAGAGAITFTFANNDDPTLISAVISNRIGPNATGSVEINLRDVYPVAIQVQPQLVSMVSGTISQLQAFYLLNDGKIIEAVSPAPVPTWSSSNSTLVAVAANGTITGSVDTQGQVLITATNASANVAGTCGVTLNKII